MHTRYVSGLKTMPHSRHCYIKSPGVNEQYAHWGRAVDKRIRVISSEAGSPVISSRSRDIIGGLVLH